MITKNKEKIMEIKKKYKLMKFLNISIHQFIHLPYKLLEYTSFLKK